jgi:hypothetical protein
MDDEGPGTGTPPAGPTLTDTLNIRQRQLDRSPTKELGIDVSIREIPTAANVASNSTTQAPVPPTKSTASRWSPMKGRRQNNDAPPRRGGSGGDHRVDIAPDGGSAGREGRQFTVSNVGNNGRIYLR